VVAAVVVLGVVAAVIVTVVLRPATGIAAALEDEDFASCLGREGGPDDEPSLEGADSWSEEEEVEFWSHPLALHCASRALIEERRVRALAVAFPSLEGDRLGDVDEQWQPIVDYATWLHGYDVPQDAAMLRIASVLRGIWVAHADKGNWADGFTNSAVLADMRARDELPEFDAWLREGGSEDTAADLLAYRAEVLEKAGEETQQAYRTYLERSRALYDVVR
jgi:hypothetical protein